MQKKTGTSTYNISKSLGSHLDALRGWGALAVAVGHLRSIFFVDFNQVENKNLLVKAFYFLTGFGHQAVVVFFVLSGLLISKSCIKNMQSGNWSWRDYFTQRLTRLWVVLLPALVIGFLWDHFGMQLFGTSGIYAGDPAYGNVIPDTVSSRSDWWTYLGNALFLQNIKVFTAGTNGALWSLSYEFWYYVLFPLLALVWLDQTSALKSAVYFILLILLSYELRFSALPGFPLWLLGAAAMLTPLLDFLKVKKNYKTLVPVIFFLFLSMLCRARVNKEQVAYFMPGGEMLLSIALAVFLYSLRHRQDITVNKTYAKIAHFFSSFSYTLYLTHLPVVVFLCAALTKGTRWQPTFPNLLLAGALFVGIVAYSYLFSLITEKNTDKIRALIPVAKSRP